MGRMNLKTIGSCIIQYVKNSSSKINCYVPIFASYYLIYKAERCGAVAAFKSNFFYSIICTKPRTLKVLKRRKGENGEKRKNSPPPSSLVIISIAKYLSLTNNIY